MSEDLELIEQEEQELFEHVRIVAEKGVTLIRVDKFLMNRVENTSRNRIQNAIDAGSVRVNDKPIKASYKVKPLDVITMVLPDPPRDNEVCPENIPLDIIYEDDEVLLVNKEAGMVVHPGFNNYTGTLVNALTYHLNQLPTLPGNTGRPGLVHRIDKDTSGILIIAKSEWAMTFLAKQFYEHTINRRYIALVWGDIAEDGTVSGYIGRDLKDRRIMSMHDDLERGKWSVTHYRVLERLGFVTLIECQLETGRTHQIRAHMKSIGHPLFSDSMYGGDKILKGTAFTKYKQFIDNCFVILPRQALHARLLGFEHPISKKRMDFEVPMPQDMQQVLEKWRAYAAQING
jgi:23S rRNA pseudouridine1911/1915/1917 synthase